MEMEAPFDGLLILHTITHFISYIFLTRHPPPATRHGLPVTRHPLPATRHPRKRPAVDPHNEMHSLRSGSIVRIQGKVIRSRKLRFYVSMKIFPFFPDSSARNERCSISFRIFKATPITPIESGASLLWTSSRVGAKISKQRWRR